MRYIFFKVVRCDKSTTYDYDKSNKRAMNKIDVLSDKEVCNTWKEYKWLDEWLGNDTAYLYYADDEYKLMIKIGDKI